MYIFGLYNFLKNIHTPNKFNLPWTYYTLKIILLKIHIESDSKIPVTNVSVHTKKKKTKSKRFSPSSTIFSAKS